MTNTTKLSDLSPASYNPRTIEEKALDGLKFSLDEFGDISGIVFNKRTETLVSGHQRVRAITEKYGDLIVVHLDDENGFVETKNGKIFKIRFVDWDEDKEKFANIAANSETIQGQWTSDVSLLIEEIALSAPNTFDILNLHSLKAPELIIPVQTIEVEKQESGISQEQRSILKFGDIMAYMSEKELDQLTTAYHNFVEKNRTNFGFVTYLLGLQ